MPIYWYKYLERLSLLRFELLGQASILSRTACASAL